MRKSRLGGASDGTRGAHSRPGSRLPSGERSGHAGSGGTQEYRSWFGPARASPRGLPSPERGGGHADSLSVPERWGRWLAFESDETGRNEVYVRPFPEVCSGKWAVSVGGGVMPLWSQGGNGIFYVNAAREMVEARISTTPSFAVRDREVLFHIGPELVISRSGGYTLYDITPDDERFVMLQREERETVELILVLNWFEELKERMAPS